MLNKEEIQIIFFNNHVAFMLHFASGDFIALYKEEYWRYCSLHLFSRMEDIGTKQAKHMVLASDSISEKE